MYNIHPSWRSMDLFLIIFLLRMEIVQYFPDHHRMHCNIASIPEQWHQLTSPDHSGLVKRWWSGDHRFIQSAIKVIRKLCEHDWDKRRLYWQTSGDNMAPKCKYCMHYDVVMMLIPVILYIYSMSFNCFSETCKIWGSTWKYEQNAWIKLQGAIEGSTALQAEFHSPFIALYSWV